MSLEKGDHPRFRDAYERSLDLLRRLALEEVFPEDVAREHANMVLQALMTDSRTGLLNAEGLKFALQSAIDIAVERKRPLSVIYIDGRHFKTINDTLSHETGHRVIVAIGKAIESICKSNLNAWVHEIENHIVSDHGREGGDEFVVICYESYGNAVHLARKLKEEIPSRVHKDIPIVGEKIPGGFKVSTGTAELRKIVEVGGVKRPETAEELLKRSEERMYMERLAEKGFLGKLKHLPVHFSDILFRTVEALHNFRERS